MSGSLMALSFTPTTQLVFPCSFSGKTFSKHRYNLAPLLQILTQIKSTQCIAAVFSTQTGATLTATTSTSTSKKLPVSTYLMERLGFSDKEALTASAKLVSKRTSSISKNVTDLISFENADTVITYLLGVGLDLSQVKKLVTRWPRVLTNDVEKTIKPKIKLLQDLGFSTSDLARVLSANPVLYLEYDLGPAIQALRGIMGNDEDVVKALKGFKYGTANNILRNLIPNVTMLENEYGIPKERIRKFMTKTPQIIIGRTEWLREVLVRMEDKWGFSRRDSALFLRALYVFGGRSDEKINSKCQVFRSYGWSDSDILLLITKKPSCLHLSEATMKKKLEFYMNELGYDLAYVASRPTLLTMNLENRVVPRHRVLKILKEKGLLKANYHLLTAINLREDMFLARFILPYENRVSKLREVYAYGEAMQDEETKPYVAAE